MNAEVNGGSGRRKFTMVDWTGDGRLDIVANGDVNVRLLENVGTGDEWRFRDVGAVANGRLVGHDTAPTVVDWDGDDQAPALLISAEDGHLYYQRWNYGARLPERRPREPSGDLADLVGSWDFDEGAGHIAADGSGYGNHGIVDGARWTAGHTGTGRRRVQRLRRPQLHGRSALERRVRCHPQRLGQPALDGRRCEAAVRHPDQRRHGRLRGHVRER